MIYGIECDFTEEEFAAIGKLVWSFTVLEHELARAAMKLRFDIAVANGTGPIDRDILNIAGGSLAKRFNEYVEALRASKPDHKTKDWIQEAQTKFPDGLVWRNRVCHGNWKRWNDGRMAIRFVDRTSLRAEDEVDYTPISLVELGKMMNTNLEWAIKVAAMAGTIA